MESNKLLVVPIGPPGDTKREEMLRAINYQLYEMLGNNIAFYDFDEELYLYKFITGDAQIIKDCNWLCNGYKELKQRHLEVLSDVDNVLIFGLHVKGNNAGYTKNLPKMYDLNYINMELDKCHRKDDYGFVNVGTRTRLRNMLSRMIFIECLGEIDIPIFHYQIDPREEDLTPVIGKDRYHIIGALKSNVGPRKPMPFFEWGLTNTYIQEVNKCRDFFFLAHVVFASRERFKTIVKKFNDCINRKRVGVKNSLHGYAGTQCGTQYKKENDSEVISQDKYYYKLMTSRYTFVNQPFAEDEFNYQRFMEAIILGCIPFIDDKMNLENLRLTYPEFYDIIIKRKLIIETEADSYKDIADRMRTYAENGDSEIIDEFKSTKAFKALTNKEKIKECWRKKLRWKDV